ncbi:MAG: aldehyde dehydrogenase family protein [Rhodospirillaceae bacterium]|nr:MAG: aldehyde dehydrogenase family protein [Rhodospirillaceae bacterium]
MRQREAVHCNLIGDQWVGGAPTPNVNPSDWADEIGLYAHADASQLGAAVAAARAAFETWSVSSPQTRFDVLDRAGTLILERRDTLGQLLAREEGKILAEATAEVVRAGMVLKFFAGEAVRMAGDRMDSVRQGVDVEVTREPVGVIAIITPWNFPIAIPAWKLGPALAFGNTVVFKPAELTPGCAHALVSILREAGLPTGVVNLVMGRGSVLGDALLDSPDIDGVSFTGSVPTGRRIAARCAQATKRVQCEMGGKNPMVVLDDADMNVAIAACINGAFFSTGQRCTASSRLIVTKGVHERFIKAMSERVASLKVGSALDPATEIGPVVDQKQFESNLDYLDLAHNEGAKIVGGQKVKQATEGWFLSPALLLDTTPSMRVNREEIFGPIASVIRVADYEEAVAVANDTEFGLSAGICTTSLRHARDFKRRARAGMVMVNLPTAGVDYHAPFGGRRASSFGPREQGSYAREFYTIVKTCYTG